MTSELSPIQDFAVELLAKDALSKMRWPILTMKLLGLQAKEIAGELEEIDLREYGFVIAEIQSRLRKGNQDTLRSALGINLIKEPGDTALVFYDRILPGKFLVGTIVIWPKTRSTNWNGYVVPVMLSEHGLFSSLEEIDTRSPMRLMRLVQKWNRESPLVFSVGTPVLADYDDVFKDPAAFAEKVKALTAKQEIYYSGQALIDLRPQEEKAQSEAA